MREGAPLAPPGVPQRGFFRGRDRADENTPPADGGSREVGCLRRAGAEKRGAVSRARRGASARARAGEAATVAAGGSKVRARKAEARMRGRAEGRNVPPPQKILMRRLDLVVALL